MRHYVISLAIPGVEKDRKIHLERLELDYLQKGNGDWANIQFHLYATEGSEIKEIIQYDKDGKFVGVYKLVKEESPAEKDDSEFYGDDDAE
jgi:hypothetical protein